MQILGGKLNIDFMGRRKIAMALSGLLMAVALGAIIVRGLNLGIDFTGGTLVEVGYPEPVELESIRQALERAGFAQAIVQHFGTPRDVLIRIGLMEGVSQNQISDKVLETLRSGGHQVDLRRVEFVGPQVGEELTEDGGLAMLYALIGILIYVWLRFEIRFSAGAITALVHDTLITVGVFALFQLEFDLPVLAAVLAIIGYSLNDTIVVFDRIRENFRKIRKGSSEEVMNRSINETLSRTIVTSLTTLLVLVALFLIGGEVIHNFSLALIIGVVVGTYSSIYVASTAALMLGVSRADLMVPPKEGSEADQRP